MPPGKDKDKNQTPEMCSEIGAADTLSSTLRSRARTTQTPGKGLRGFVVLFPVYEAAFLAASIAAS
ncbi:hypothetical protein PLACP1_14250 [Planifilum fimeticola]